MKRRSLRFGLVCLAALAGAGAPATSQERERAQAAGPVDVVLSLDQCLRLALENNLDLVSARVDPAIAEQTIEALAAEFDPTFFTGANHSESESEVFNITDITSSTTDSANAGITQNLAFGGDVQLSLGAARNEVAGAFVDPALATNYGSSVDLVLNVPLWRGRGKEFRTEQLQLARGDFEVSHETLRQTAHAVMERVEGAYWDVAAARERLRIARLALTRALDLLELNRKKVEVGTLAPIQITEAEAQVAGQEQELILAEMNLENAEDLLLQELAVAEDSPLWGQAIGLSDVPSFAPVDVDLPAALSVALDHRPELAQAEQRVRNRVLSERVARNETKPALGLRVAVSPSGNNFTAVPGPDGVLGTLDDERSPTGKLGESLSELPEFVSYDWSVGVNFSYPIGNRAAKANYAIATLNRERAEIDLNNAELGVRVDVRNRVRAVQSGVKRVEAARKNVELQEKKLEAEERKFDNGMSTSFQVLSFQNDLAAAERSEIDARLDYLKALTGLERAKGTLLEARGLSL